MRICILTHGSLPFGRQYAEIFSSRGHVVDFYSLSPCEALPGIHVRTFSGVHPAHSSSRYHYFGLIPAVRAALREDNPDLLLAMYLTSAGTVGLFSGCRNLVVSALGTDVNSSLDNSVLKMLLRRVCKKACLVHAVSAPLAEALIRDIQVPYEKILVAPIGVDTGALLPPPPASRPRAGRILCTRNAGDVYDHSTLLRAMKLLLERGVDCTCTFTLKSYGEVEIEAHALGLESQIEFLNGYALDSLPSLMGSHDVYVSCSLSDGTSQSLLEAMSTGTFPVVSDIPANRPWVNHGKTGMLFPPGDAAALANCLEEVFARPELAESVTGNIRSLVLEKGDSQREADRLLQAMLASCRP